jgi:Bacterial SH3 domain
MKRLLFSFFALALFLATYVPAQAQGGPSDPVKDAIFADLSARIGRPLNWRRLDGSWTFEELVVNNNNLGCDNGGNVAPGVTRAWRFDINLPGIGTYAYHLTLDGSVIILCSGTGIGAPGAPVATPLPAIGGGGISQPEQPASANQPTTYASPVVAFLSADGNVRVSTLNPTTTATSITGDALAKRVEGGYIQYQRRYSHLRWSPDGLRLAYLDTTQGKLFIVSSGTGPLELASGLNALFPPVWLGSTEIAYAVSTGAGGPDGLSTVEQVQAIAVTGGTPRVVGQFVHGTGCGGAGYGPAMALYLTESNLGLAFHVLPTGILHSVNCSPGGVAFSNLAGELIWSLPNKGRFALSPDGARIATIRLNGADQPDGIDLVNVTTGQVTPLSTNANPDVVAWSGDGATLIYGTRTLRETVSLPENAGRDWMSSIDRFDLRLYAMPAAGGASTDLFSTVGFAIGTISPSPNTALAAFTVIGDEEAMARAAALGGSEAAVASLGPIVKLHVAALAFGIPGYPFEMPGMAGSPALSLAPQFGGVPGAVVPGVSVVPPTAAAPITGTTGDNPLGLVVGGKAVVPAGGNVNLRSEPNRANPANVLGILRPGDIVTVLSGPLPADGLRWWQVRRDTDGVTGYVVDQFTNSAGGVENNLLPLR